MMTSDEDEKDPMVELILLSDINIYLNRCMHSNLFFKVTHIMGHSSILAQVKIKCVIAFCRLILFCFSSQFGCCHPYLPSQYGKILNPDFLY